MAVETERDPQTVGELVRFLLTQRRLTQMEFALDANLSTKHLSFVETGRRARAASSSSTSPAEIATRRADLRVETAAAVGRTAWPATLCP